MKKLLLALTLALPLSTLPLTIGCAHTVNAPTPTPIQKAAVTLDDLTILVQKAQQAETIAFNAGQVDAATHKTLSQAFINIADKETAVGKLIAASASAADLNAAVNALIAEVKTDISSGVLGVKNPTTQAQLNALITTVQVLGNQILVAYGA